MNRDLKSQYEKVKRTKFVYAVIIDFVGFIIDFIPIVGIPINIIWGGISGYLIFVLFPKHTKLAIFGAAEEILPIPFTSIIPTAYITWYRTYEKDHEKTFSDFLTREAKDEKLVRDITKRNTHEIESD